MFKVLISVLVLFSASALVHADDCVKSLEQNLHGNSEVVGQIIDFKDAYVCNGGKACAVVYDVDNHPYGTINVLAYQDTERNIVIPWNNKDDDGSWGGWIYSGHFWCADVKTYGSATVVNPETIKMEVVKSTAYDAMFCPITKTYFDYTTTCTKL